MSAKIKIIIILFLISNFCFSQVPALNSMPSVTSKVIYLDFDGQVVSGTAWNSGNTINALPSTMSANNIRLIWRRVSEDFRPFEVNVTTDEARFNSAPANSRIRVIITPTSAWYGSAGGVAYVNSFTWGGTPGTPCWVFENQLGYNSKSIAEAASHEVGHTLSLRHHSIYNNNCVKTAEYNSGVGSGVTSWAPIMGVGYSRNVTIWHFGPNSTGCTTIQYDHSANSVGMTKPGFLNFLPDDVGDNFANSKILNLNTINLVDSGIITQPNDIDAYQFSICNNRYVNIQVKPWALDTINYSGANLDVRFHLYNSANNLIVLDTTLNRLHTRVGVNLVPGTYYFTVDGGRSNNYTDYGSLGKYYINIKATNPPTLVNSIITASNICAGQNTTLTYSSNGTPTQWQWNITGPSAGVFTTQYPSLAFTPGHHTISLLATNSSSPSCPTIMTLDVSSSPNLSMLNPNSVVCAGNSVTLSVSGAASYTWLPGALGGSSQIVSPSATSSYTINGSNGTCINSLVTTVTVTPDYILNTTISSQKICEGESVTLTLNGASGYTINPGNITDNPAILSPSITTYYLINSSSGACHNNGSLTVTVTPHYNLSIYASDTLICGGSSATLVSTGATSYTFNPGGLIGYTTVVNPSVTTSYTVTGSLNGQCEKDTAITIHVKLCDYTGIHEERVQQPDIRIYPNPSRGSFTVESGGEYKKLHITNLIGQVIYTANIENNITFVNSKNWAAGVYFINLYTNSTDFKTEKIIIE